MVTLASIRVGFTLVISISCCLSCFLSCWLPNVNVVSGGIWAFQIEKEIYCKENSINSSSKYSFFKIFTYFMPKAFPICKWLVP